MRLSIALELLTALAVGCLGLAIKGAAAHCYITVELVALHALLICPQMPSKLFPCLHRSGVFNDLGSGSNVDLCVITKEGVEYKRNYELLQVGGGFASVPCRAAGSADKQQPQAAAGGRLFIDCLLGRCKASCCMAGRCHVAKRA